MYVIMDGMEEHILGYVSHSLIPTTLLDDYTMLISSITFQRHVNAHKTALLWRFSGLMLTIIWLQNSHDLLYKSY